MGTDIFFLNQQELKKRKNNNLERRKEEWRGRSSRLMDGPSVFFSLLQRGNQVA
jgi:hypothetical protein